MCESIFCMLFGWGKKKVVEDEWRSKEGKAAKKIKFYFIMSINELFALNKLEVV